MCCCYIRSCCFGCRSLPSGVFILSLLNLVVNITLLVLPWLVITLVDENGYKGWLIILMAADISLGIGAKTKNKVLLLPWMIIYIIHTLLTLVIGPLIIIGSILAATEFRKSNFLEENFNTTRNHIDGFLPSENSLDIFLDKLESKAPKDETDIKRISGLVVAGFLPLWYIYCWIAVKSLYRLLAILDTETER
ncbi:uncharacterized protein LOC111698103 isoform X2 [Eurytemora carolleeae]|uniref:uncharacterized protein LOC111698103 isoform X2 n=1 Tax=Eurytemora carolleeae TaxID=1294199 RepID=UPI000C772095|nr:uncharacterized protein LOC111698103 isoform X2 [Eurytemora carolleeae]|eukprot:XP_023324117.1 uncharacterized protein LOC111698103 isoform X2 [Eurytemora affinis]